MDQHYSYTGLIEYGKYSEDLWYGFKEFSHPLLQDNIDRVLDKKHVFDNFNLVGGVLEDWITWDVDWILTGPFYPYKIEKALDWIIKVGFEKHIFNDAVYVKELFDLQKPGCTDSISYKWVYKITNNFKKEGIKKDCSHYLKLNDNLYTYRQQVPYKKQLEKINEGHVYQSPLKLL